MDDAAEEEDAKDELIEKMSAHFGTVSTFHEELDDTGEPIDDNLEPSPPVKRSQCKRIKIDVKTRWNSTYLMLQSIFALEKRIMVVLAKYNGRNLMFDSQELLVMQNLVEILKPFYKATLTASELTKSSTSVRLTFQLINLLDHLTRCEKDKKFQVFFCSWSV